MNVCASVKCAWGTFNFFILLVSPRFPDCADAYCRPCYRPLKHGLFVLGFSFLDGLLGLLVAVVAVVVVVVVVEA